MRIRRSVCAPALAAGLLAGLSLVSAPAAAQHTKPTKPPQASSSTHKTTPSHGTTSTHKTTPTHNTTPTHGTKTTQATHHHIHAVAKLHAVEALLHKANHDSKGLRVKALHDLRQALHALHPQHHHHPGATAGQAQSHPTTPAATAKSTTAITLQSHKQGGHLSQAASDALLRQAIKQLRALQSELGSSHGGHAAELNGAINQATGARQGACSEIVFLEVAQADALAWLESPDVVLDPALLPASNRSRSVVSGNRQQPARRIESVLLGDQNLRFR